MIGSFAWLVLRVGEGRTSGLIGLVGGVIAAPGLLVAGAPFADDTFHLHAVAGSALLWMAIGWLASRRATRSPIATWSDFWREYVWLGAGVALGAVGALVAAAALLGESFL